jgi:hypothetical protein
MPRNNQPGAGGQRVPILPIPPEFEYLEEDVYPLTGGGFKCYMCGASTESIDLHDLKHARGCNRAKRTHGEARSQCADQAPPPKIDAA